MKALLTPYPENPLNSKQRARETFYAGLEAYFTEHAVIPRHCGVGADLYTELTGEKAHPLCACGCDMKFALKVRSPLFGDKDIAYIINISVVDSGRSCSFSTVPITH